MMVGGVAGQYSEGVHHAHLHRFETEVRLPTGRRRFAPSTGRQSISMKAILALLLP